MSQEYDPGGSFGFLVFSIFILIGMAALVLWGISHILSYPSGLSG
jgi:hypothetical protein